MSIQRAKARRSRIHGTGLFATEDIPKGEKIIEYTGEKITKTEAVRRYEVQSEEGAIYLFDLNKRHDVDGASGGNDAKYANHSCSPNAETIIERGQIWIYAKRDLKKGEEILYDYNFPYFDHHKRPCRCGSENCRGWIMSRRAYRYMLNKNGQRERKAGVAERHATSSKQKERTTPTKKGAKKAAKRVGKVPAKKAPKRSDKRAGKKTVKKGGKKTTRTRA